MTVLAMTGGDAAMIVLAVGWVVLVGGLLFVLLNTFRVLESTKMTIDAMREETIPLLREVKTSVEKTNREIDRVDVMLDNANSIVGAGREALGIGRGGRLEPVGQDHQHRLGAPQGLLEGIEGIRQGIRQGIRMIRRLFWMAFGVGLGATTAVIASRWTRKQAKKAAPATIAREAKGGLLDLTKLVTASVDEGRRAMDERERELRTTYGLDEAHG